MEKALQRLLLIAALTACSSPTVIVHTIPNLAQVESNIWRSGQITSQEGWNYIQTLAGTRHVHVIKLNFDSEGSDAIATTMGFDVHVLSVQPEGDQDLWDDALSVFKGPDPKLIEAALAELRFCRQHASTDICLGHCTHGQDRTGYLFGRYRVEDDGWSKDAAFAEMLSYGFHPALLGVYEAWRAFMAPQ